MCPLACMNPSLAAVSAEPKPELGADRVRQFGFEATSSPTVTGLAVVQPVVRLTFHSIRTRGWSEAPRSSPYRAEAGSRDMDRFRMVSC
jgi:hypothetical protein